MTSAVWLEGQWVKALAPLSSKAPLSAEALAYLAYYRVDLAASGLGLEQHLGYFEAAGYRLIAQSLHPAKARATLVLLHGYYDHMGLYGHVLRWALAHDIAVITCDLPGHGLSSGARASIDDFSEYQQVLKGLLMCAEEMAMPRPWHLCGQSTGAAIALDYLLHAPSESSLGTSVLLAPLVRPRAWRRSEWSYRLSQRWIRQIPRRFTQNSTDAQFLDFLKSQDPLQPRHLPSAWVGALARWVKHIEAAPAGRHQALIIQGREDQTVDWPYNLGVLQTKLPNSQQLLLERARHHLVNEAAPIRDTLFSAMAKSLC